MGNLAKQPARASGNFALGGDLRVTRLGYSATQIPSPSVWGEPRDHNDVVGPLQRIADEHAVARAQLALARLLQRSPVVLPIPGTSTVAHLEENVAGALIELAVDQVQQLNSMEV
jgi:aryl-alcohol dehydrogenase-like predicted oxidoreductase